MRAVGVGEEVIGLDGVCLVGSVYSSEIQTRGAIVQRKAWLYVSGLNDIIPMQKGER